MNGRELMTQSLVQRGGDLFLLHLTEKGGGDLFLLLLLLCNHEPLEVG